MYVVLLGPPGAGKGTQAVALAERFGWPHISTGDLLREAVDQGSEIGKVAKGYMDRGELVPDGLVVSVVVDRLSRPDASDGAVLDGFPRNIEQARQLDRELERRNAGVDLAIYLRVSEQAVVARLAGRWSCRGCGAMYHEVANPPATPGVCDRCGGVLYQRPDDRPGTVRRRLEVYNEQTEPVLQYYRDRGALVEVDGERPIREVVDQVAAAVLSAGLRTPGGVCQEG